MPKSTRHANATPLAAYQGTPGRLGKARAALVAAVVEMVRVPVPAAAPVMFSGLVAPKLKVGGYAAPAGLAVTAAVRVTLPVKPLAGVTVMVEVLPVVAPGANETAVAVTVKGAATEIEVLVAPLNPVALADSVYVPEVVKSRLLNVATPFTAFTVSVPLTPAGVELIVTAAAEVTRLPLASST
jgi:hypothetical protein